MSCPYVAGCDCRSDSPDHAAPSFEERVVNLARALWENRPREFVMDPLNIQPVEYTWSDALADATDIVLAADGFYIEENQ